MNDPVVIAIAVWVASAIICGFLAPSKGRESGQWFLGGLIFGVFAVLALAFAAPMKPVDPSEQRVCVNCGKPVAADRKQRCQNCGELFATARSS